VTSKKKRQVKGRDPKKNERGKLCRCPERGCARLSGRQRKGQNGTTRHPVNKRKAGIIKRRKKESHQISRVTEEKPGRTGEW